MAEQEGMTQMIKPGKMYVTRQYGFTLYEQRPDYTQRLSKNRLSSTDGPFLITATKTVDDYWFVELLDSAGHTRKGWLASADDIIEVT